MFLKACSNMKRDVNGCAGWISTPIVAAGAVIADLGVGEHHDLTGIRRVCETLLVARKRGVENHFAGPFRGGAKTAALEDGTVLQGEQCRGQVRLFLRGSG